MSDSTQFLTVEQILEIHQRMVREFGGDAGVRDQGLLRSAAAMPMAGMGGKFLHEGIPEMAAAYLFHLCKNHPFVDGNKRSSLAATEVFLLINNHLLQATGDELEHLTLGVADGSISKAEATVFFRDHVIADIP